MKFTNIPLTNIGIATQYYPVITNSLILYLDAAVPTSYNGSSTWYDLSSQGYQGSIQSGVSYSIDGGGSLRFDGSSNGYVQLGGGFGYDYSAGFTAMVVAKFDSSTRGFTAWQRLFDFGSPQGAGNAQLILCRYGNTDTVLMDINTINDNAYGYNLNPGEMPLAWDQWAVYCMFADGTYWKEYLNGSYYSYEGNTTLPATVTRSYNYIGKSNWSADSMFTGNIAAVMMWNRALTEPEIYQNYQHFQKRIAA